MRVIRRVGPRPSLLVLIASRSVTTEMPPVRVTRSGRHRPRTDLLGDRGSQLALYGLLVLPFLIATARVLSHDPFVPLGDSAALDLDVRNLGSSLPSDGSYSQFGFHHPGPLYTLWMWLWAQVLDDGRAYQLGMITMSGLLVLGAALLIHRSYGPRWMAATVGFMLALTLGFGWAALGLEWNPKVALLGVPALLLCAVAALDGDRVALLAAVAAASLLTQAHLGNAPLAVSTILLLAAATFYRVPDFRRWIRSWVPALALGALLWALPLIGQLRRGTEGNLYRILDFSRVKSGPSIGLEQAGSALLRPFRPVPEWLGSVNAAEGVPDRGFSWWLLVVCAGVGALVLNRANSRDRSELREQTGPLGWGLGMTLVASVLSALALSMSVAPVRMYLVYHLEALAAVAVGLSLAAVAVVTRSLWDRGILPIRDSFAIALLAILSLTSGIYAWKDSPEGTSLDSSVEQIMSDLEALAGDSTVVVSRVVTPGVSPEFSYTSGLVAQIARSMPLEMAGDTSPDGEVLGGGMQVVAPSAMKTGRADPEDLDIRITDGTTPVDGCSEVGRLPPVPLVVFDCG